MKPNTYISDSFLLESSLAQQLFHDYAKTLPIIDYHTHLDAADIYRDQTFKNLTQAWLNDDHYVWRGMRSVGIDEYYITGQASDYDKFKHWCVAMPKLIGSPLYQWCHLELKRFFNIDLLLCPQNCHAIWQASLDKLQHHAALSPQKLLIANRVNTLCTTDDPSCDLKYHQLLAKQGFKVNVRPTFRADPLVQVGDQKEFQQTLIKLSHTSGIPIHDWMSFKQALNQRIDYFHQHGCRLSDLGLGQITHIDTYHENPCDLFNKIITSKPLSQNEQLQLSAEIFHVLATAYNEKNWTMQLHIGVMANVNQRRLADIGKGTGFSVMHDSQLIQGLAQRLDRLDCNKQLPQTILYNLNPKDTWPLASLIGAFQDSDSAAGKIQLGPAWWFNDHKRGMIEQMNALANLSSLGQFVGMLTDSRSVFSLSRHGYFRRVLCNLLAQWAQSGDIPNDQALLKNTIENICYHNAKNYFKF